MMKRNSFMVWGWKGLKNKYIVLKLQKQIDIIKLRDMLNDLIDGDDAIGLSVKWLDIADILLVADGSLDNYNNNEDEEERKVDG